MTKVPDPVNRNEGSKLMNRRTFCRGGVLAAAGMIALTAVACLEQGRRENEEADGSRTRVMVHSPGQKIAESWAPAQEEGQPALIYHVEIERGSRLNEVVIDARTGKILGKREITAMAA